MTETREVARRDSWIPYLPKEIITLAQDPQSRIVQTGEQLIEVLIDALKKIEGKLQQAETPLAFALWNEGKRDGLKTWAPKDENTLSNYVKREMAEYLNSKQKIILNREVEIRRNEGSPPGERTDIHVDIYVQRALVVFL